MFSAHLPNNPTPEQPFSPLLRWECPTSKIPGLEVLADQLLALNGKDYRPISEVEVQLISTGTGMLLCDAIEQDPSLVQMYRAHALDRFPAKLSWSGSLFHLVSANGEQEVICAPLECPEVEAFLADLTDRLNKSTLRISSALAKRLVDSLISGHGIIVPVFGDSALKLDCAPRVFESYLGARGQLSAIRAYPVDVNGRISERLQYELGLSASDISFENRSSPEVVGSILDAAKIKLQPPPERALFGRAPAEFTTKVSSLSTLTQGAFYRAAFTGKEEKLLVGAPLKIPEYVCPYRSPEEILQALRLPGKVPAQPDYYETMWKWRLATTGEHHLDAVVRFHSKVADSLGDNPPSFVFELYLKKGSKILESFVVLNAGPDNPDVKRARELGVTIFETAGGLTFVTRKTKELSHQELRGLRQRIDQQHSAGQTEAAAELVKQREIVMLLRRLEHFKHSPEQSPTNRGLWFPILHLLSQDPTPRPVSPHAARGYVIPILEEFSIRNSPIASLHLPTARLEVVRQGFYYFVRISPRNQPQNYIFRINLAGAVESCDEVVLGAKGPLISSVEPPEEVLSQGLDDAKIAMLFDSFKQSLPDYQAFSIPEKLQCPAAKIGRYASRFAEILEKTRDPEQSEALSELITYINGELAPHAPGQSLFYVSYIHDDFRYTISRSVTLPEDPFFVGAQAREEVRMYGDGKIISANAEVYGRSISKKISTPTLAEVSNFLAHLAWIWDNRPAS